MSNENPISLALKALREGSLFVRRAQLIAKDFSKGVPASPEALREAPNALEFYSLDRFAAEVLADASIFKNIPAPIATSRFDLLLGIPKGNCNQLWKLWKSMFQCESPFGDTIDQEIVEGGITDQSYMFRIFRSVEPDEETLGMSSNEIRRKRISAISLPELMIAEMFHFKMTRGGHLNLSQETLCAGTKFKDGTSPVVRFQNSRVVIDWAKSDHAEPKLGTRLVVKR